MCGRGSAFQNDTGDSQVKHSIRRLGEAASPNQIDPCNHQAVIKVGNRSHMKQLKHLGKDSRNPESWYDLQCPRIGNGLRTRGHADRASTGFDQQQQ